MGNAKSNASTSTAGQNVRSVSSTPPATAAAAAPTSSAVASGVASAAAIPSTNSGSAATLSSSSSSGNVGAAAASSSSSSRRSATGYDFHVFIDTSGSMYGEKLQNAKAAVVKLFEHMAEADRFELHSFASAVTPMCPFRPKGNPAAVVAAAQALDADGNTKLYDALGVAVRRARECAPADGSRHARIVFLTDGEDVSSALSLQGAIGALSTRAEHARARLYVIAIEQDASNAALRALSDCRGAKVILGSSERTIRKAFRKMFVNSQMDSDDEADAGGGGGASGGGAHAEDDDDDDGPPSPARSAAAAAALAGAGAAPGVFGSVDGGGGAPPPPRSLGMRGRAMSNCSGGSAGSWDDHDEAATPRFSDLHHAMMGGGSEGGGGGEALPFSPPFRRSSIAGPFQDNDSPPLSPVLGGGGGGNAALIAYLRSSALSSSAPSTTEGAAATPATAAAAGAAAASGAPLSDDASCQICLSAPKGVAFNCGHVTCESCAASQTQCPYCRAPITLRLKLFTS